ncbi:hypothetical protein [Sphingopyxis sp.]|jgi:hypothetical protein|uniref:hypothetical protein n=1 Tax=Sphingopyxis sp. TaxID=1908224 RepID=UPI002DED76CB|nr:hypothetical protein [Sphingopyxis sp.]
MTADGDVLPILIRAFSTTPDDPTSAGKTADSGQRKSRRAIPAIGPADIYLVFDTETTLDPAMRCRIGFYQLYRDGTRIDERLFYDPNEAFTGDTDVIHGHAAARDMASPVTLDAFRALFRKVLRAGGQVVGFNLPFDISRVAIGSAPAKASKWNRKMQGAHSLCLWDGGNDPRIQIKHLNPRLALIGSTSPNPGKARSTRKRGDDIPADRGAFIDVRTLASALLSGGYSLEKLCRTLDTPTQKTGTSEHGKALTFDYLDYARADVQATWECFCVLRDRYAGYGLSTPLHRILSEAGLGKAMLSDMGITINADSDPARIARSLHSYFGGRTEVRIRRKPVRVVQTDFMSMYPTGCTLMGLWSFVIARNVVERDSTDEVRNLLANTEADDWREQAAWRKLTTLVRVRCAEDMFPVRTYYQGEQHASIGLNPLTCETPLWFTLADCLASKFHSGKVPEIVEAVTFEPGPPQKGMKPISLLGRLTIDPYRDDPFRELIVMRERERQRIRKLPKPDRKEAEEFRQFLKIMVNSTSYGIFVQINTQDEERKVWRTVHVHGQESFAALLSKSEEPGPCFHPLLGTLITGAARLMLALAQQRAGAEGLNWAFCDTDSIALAMPDGMDEADFLDRAGRVSEWFVPLNPYGWQDSILKVEDVNFRPGTDIHEPLYCYAIASKRYALFNIDDEGRPIIRKASAHGLGHLLPPYKDDEGAPEFPLPIEGLKAGKDRLARWQYDVWYATLLHELSGAPGAVRFDFHSALLKPAISRYGASSPALLRWMDPINGDRAYPDRVKPFGLLYCLHARKRGYDFTGAEALGGGKATDIHPIAPFHSDRDIAIFQAFDRITGEPVSVEQLKTYAEMLAPYPYRQESKFRNGEAFHRGETILRHVTASEIQYIGKEADRWEEDFLIGLGFEPMTMFGCNPNDATEMFNAIREAAALYGQKPVADATGLARASIKKICEGKDVRTRISYEIIRQGLRRVRCKPRQALPPQHASERINQTRIDIGRLISPRSFI